MLPADRGLASPNACVTTMRGRFSLVRDSSHRDEFRGGSYISSLELRDENKVNTAVVDTDSSSSRRAVIVARAYAEDQRAMARTYLEKTRCFVATQRASAGSANSSCNHRASRHMRPFRHNGRPRGMTISATFSPVRNPTIQFWRVKFKAPALDICLIRILVGVTSQGAKVDILHAAATTGTMTHRRRACGRGDRHVPRPSD
jgi:hypothetical protein